jgi:hypothetical protein
MLMQFAGLTPKATKFTSEVLQGNKLLQVAFAPGIKASLLLHCAAKMPQRINHLPQFPKNCAEE